MKKEHFANSGIPNCNSANPCSNYTKGSSKHNSCIYRKWEKCPAIDGRNFFTVRMTQAKKSNKPMNPNVPGVARSTCEDIIKPP